MTNYICEAYLNEIPEGEENSYPFYIPSIKFLKNNKLSFKKPVTFFVGENGTGKSTLIEALAVFMGFNPEGGSKEFRFSTNDTHSDLYEFLKVSRSGYPKDGFFLRAESFYNVADFLDRNGNLDFYGGISLNEQSHGESFFSLLLNRFKGKGLYILDEPEAALSPQKLMSLLVLINNLVKDDSQFIISTHSPILTAFPDSDIFKFSDKGIEKISYKEQESYIITKQFLDNPQRMLKYLFSEN